MRIQIQNEVTRNTVRKMVRYHYYAELLENKGENQSTMENLENGFISKEALDFIVETIFKEKNDGSFLNSTKSVFNDASRNKLRFLKNVFVELRNGAQ